MSISENDYEELSSCPYCHSSRIRRLFFTKDYVIGLPGTFYLSRCEDCHLAFQNPRVKESVHSVMNFTFMEDHYGQEENLAFQKKSSIAPPDDKPLIPLTPANRRVLTNHFGYPFGASNRLDRLRSWIHKAKFEKVGIPKFKVTGDVLEIGCGKGQLLKQLKEWGWTVHGVEPSPEMTAIANKYYGLDVRVDTVEHLMYPPNSFDAVIMIMVLEHLYDPFEALRRIVSWIKPGGEFIFAIPYFEGLEFRLHGKYAHSLALPHHVLFPNRAILREELQQSGFENVEFTFHSFDRDFVAPFNVRRKEKGLSSPSIINNHELRKWVIRPLLTIAARMGLTSRVTVRATKKV